MSDEEKNTLQGISFFVSKKDCTADLLIFVHLCSIFPAPPSAVPVPANPNISETFRAALTLKYMLHHCPSWPAEGAGLGRRAPSEAQKVQLRTRV